MSRHFSWQGAVTKSDLAASTKLVLLVIGTYMNQHGEGAFPSYKKLASDTSLNRVTVIRHVELAVELGWLTKRSRVRVSEASGRLEADSNTYLISFPVVAQDYQGSSAGQPPLVAEDNHPSCAGQPPLVAQRNPITPSLSPQLTQEHAPVVPDGDHAAGELQLSDGDQEARRQVSPAEVIRDAYNDLLGHRSGCIACRAMNPKFTRRLQQVDKDARKACADNGMEYEPEEFWRLYFTECLKDPWMRGDRPNPRNARWKQSLKTLVDDERFLQIVNVLLAAAEGEVQE